MRPWVSVLLLLALAGRLSAADDLSQGRKDLGHIKREIKSARKELAGQAKAEQSLLKNLEGLNRQVDASRRDMLTHERNLKIVEDRLAALSRLSAQYRADVDAGRGMLAKELRLMHRSGPLGEVKLLLSAREPAELISRYRFLKSLARQNAARVALCKRRLAEAEEYAREYQARELELKNHKAGAESARLRAEAEKRRRAALLNGVRAKKSRTESLIRELALSAQNLESKMLELQRAAESAARAELQARRRRSGTFTGTGGVELDQGPSRLGRRHSLPWPVHGRLLTRFGEQMHPKFHTKVFNRGVEIAAPLGSPVLAVADGKVGFADYFEGYGQMVILDHGGGQFTVYGHNSNLAVAQGARVRQGEAIAEVGDSSTSGVPALYFEVRSLAKAVDPLAWLKRQR